MGKTIKLDDGIVSNHHNHFLSKTILEYLVKKHGAGTDGYPSSKRLGRLMLEGASVSLYFDEFFTHLAESYIEFGNKTLGIPHFRGLDLESEKAKGTRSYISFLENKTGLSYDVVSKGLKTNQNDLYTEEFGRLLLEYILPLSKKHMPSLESAVDDSFDYDTDFFKDHEHLAETLGLLHRMMDNYELDLSLAYIGFIREPKLKDGETLIDGLNDLFERTVPRITDTYMDKLPPYFREYFSSVGKFIGDNVVSYLKIHGHRSESVLRVLQEQIPKLLTHVKKGALHHAVQSSKPHIHESAKEHPTYKKYALEKLIDPNKNSD